MKRLVLLITLVMAGLFAAGDITALAANPDKKITRQIRKKAVKNVGKSEF